jgi:glycosyltransferase involved in cell wall biosynthesis
MRVRGRLAGGTPRSPDASLTVAPRRAVAPIPPRILHVYKDVHPTVPGGIERHVDILRRAVEGYRSDVLVSRRGIGPTQRREVAGGEEIAVWQAGRLLSSPLTLGYGRWIRRLRPDLVHVHMPNPVGELAMLRIPRSTPVVASYHADIVRQASLLPAYGVLIRAALNRADVVISGTQRLTETSPFVSAVNHKTRVLRYACDVNRFRPAPGRSPIPDRRLRVIATGRLVYYKGFDRLIRLAARIDADFVIVGGGPLEMSLRQRAESLPNVRITGRVPDAELEEILRTGDLFVLPSTSRAESFGIATIEAQASGLPAIVTDVGTGTVEAIEPGVTGLVVAPGDDDALSGAITSLLADPDRRSAMGRAARARAVELFSVEATARAHAGLYRELLDGS